MSLDDLGPALASVVLAPGQQPFSLTPVIDDIIRTQYCVPGSIFLIEGIELVPLSKSGRWQAVRLLIGDGELCIQGLLAGEMHRLIDTQELTVGCYVRVEKFHFKRQVVSVDERAAGRNQTMVYLVLESLITIGWNEEFREMWQRTQLNNMEESSQKLNKREEMRNPQTPQKPASQIQLSPKDFDQTVGGENGFESDDQEIEDAFEAFESMTFPAPKKELPKTTTPVSLNSKSGAVALPQDWHDHKTPLKLTTLHAIPRLPYKQNWSCNILAIVTSLSEIEPSHLSPYRQRTARLADPSTSKRVHLTIFLDPDGFQPQLGSAVLLVGVKNHRFDGGSLKKYASDEGKGKWWFENPYELDWCNVEGIKGWWADVQEADAEGA